MKALKKIFVVLCFLSVSLSYSQYANSKTVKQLDKLISDENYTEAQDYLQQSIDVFRKKKDYYLLTSYIYYTGKINLQLYNQAKADKSVENFIATITTATDSAKVLRQVKIELATYFELLGDSKKAYDSNIEALKITENWKEATPADFGLIENNLCVLSTRKGDIAQGIKHGNKALKHYESYPKTNKANLYVLYNSMGANMWYESKIDSALYYYQKAEKTLELMEPTPINKLYRPATLNNNMAAIYSTQGNFDKALEAMKFTVNNLNQFIKSDVSDAKKEDAKGFLYVAIENYAGSYKDIGDYEKAKELIEYAYNEKKKHYDPKSPELFKAKILLGQIHLALKDYKLAEKFLDDGISQIQRTNGGNNFWEADAQYYKATLHEELGNNILAKDHFENSERLYEAALGGAYDELYLDFIIKASHFYAKNNDTDKALEMSKKAYEYVLKNQGSTTSFEIQQALNLGEIYYELGDYTSALEKGKSTEELLKTMLPTQSNPLDSTKIMMYKPQTILLKTQAAYMLNKVSRSVTFLKEDFKEIKEAIAIVEKQKSIIGDDTDVSFLIEQNSELFGFAKQLALDLYSKTNEKTYLNEFISLHESILYNRIRSQLNSRTSMTYTNVPNKVLEQEKTIKSTIKETLNKSGNIEAYIDANSQWKTYLNNLKKEYPKYYNLRFASISKSLDNVEKKLPENTTAIRFIYSETDLFAVLISKDETKLFKLNQSNLNSKISSLQDERSLFENNFKLLNELYVQLWKPFEKDIKTEKVVIIPDRDLFNLNFEMLSSSVALNYKELASKSLLSKYVISYNYSLFLIDKGSKTIGYEDNFVAFVPEFNDQMKSDYQIAIQDSLNLDKTYLTLLSQPFTKNLANYSTRLFNGVSFLNENSTEHVFKNSAKEHKIIHIGTHAESNNISPELSRLVFAKSMDSTNTDDNYLYTYEIYNTNLSSNLAILTACETGKPTYQAGEGMISLAHAFNYAGSESILTSLWKIDEQSSAKIIATFYKYINKGWMKDKALQQAKLDYISTAEGRTANPQYWAGLVLIGDTSPIALQTSSVWIYWLLGVLAVLLILFFIMKRAKRT